MKLMTWRILLAVGAMLLAASSAQADTSPVGVWVSVDRMGRTSVLELDTDGTGMLVRAKDGQIEDLPVRWARYGDWVGIALGPRSYELAQAGDTLSLTSLSQSPDTIVFERTERQEHLRLLPSHGPRPEPHGTEQTVVGIWATSGPREDELLVVELKANGMGAWVGVGGGTALGELFRWHREGETITVTPSASQPFEMRAEQDALFMRGAGGEEVVLRRSEEALHAQIVNVTPLPPEPPRRPSDVEGQDRYYAEGATEAVLAFGGDAVFEIGDEDLAPPKVQAILQSLRDAARPRVEQLSQTSIEISPDGRSIIIHGFRAEDGTPIAYLWDDWRDADAVAEHEWYFRGGGRFLSDRYLFWGGGAVLDRITGKRYAAPPVTALWFDVAPGGKWVGTGMDRQTVRIGTLSPHRQEHSHEFTLKGFAKEPFWTNGGRYFVLDIIQAGIRVFDAEGRMTARLKGDWRLGAQISDRQFFVSQGFAQAAMMTIDEGGSVHVGQVRNLRCRPDLVSPSGRYVIGLGFRRTGDRFDVDRTPLAVPNTPLPPRPPYGRYWISWAIADR